MASTFFFGPRLSNAPVRALSISWSVLGTHIREVVRMTDEDLELLQQSKLTDMLIGVESCSQRIIDIIKKNNIVCFEMDCSHNLITSNIACKYTMEFESIIGNGVIEIIDIDREKLTALNYIMKKYSNKKDYLFDKKKVKLTKVLRLSVTDYSGKRLKRAFI